MEPPDRGTLTWFASLTGSIDALHAAAREHRTAAHVARGTADTYELFRVRDVWGTVKRVGPGGEAEFRPHDQALMAIERTLAESADKLEQMFEAAATGFADGASWAIGEVQSGRQPRAVQVVQAGIFTQPLVRLTPTHLSVDLLGWDGWPEYKAARTAYGSCSGAGLAEVAYAYGQIAVRALQFALLGPRREHREAVVNGAAK